MAGYDRSTYLRLTDMLNEIGAISDSVAGLRQEVFSETWVVRRAVERGLEIVSEASRHLPAEIKAASPGIPWKQIAGIGNVLRHDYEAISDHVLWDIIVTHLGPLENALRRALSECGGDAEPP